MMGWPIKTKKVCRQLASCHRGFSLYQFIHGVLYVIDSEAHQIKIQIHRKGRAVRVTSRDFLERVILCSNNKYFWYGGRFLVY